MNTDIEKRQNLNNSLNEILEKKKLSLFLLKEWDNKRATFLEEHKYYLEIVISNLDNKVITSTKKNEILLSFFKGKANYYKNLNNLKIEKFISKNEENNFQISSLDKFLLEMDNMIETKGSRNKEFFEYIEKDIIKILSENKEKYESIIASHKEIIIKLKKNLEKNLKEVLRLLLIYSKNL